MTERDAADGEAGPSELVELARVLVDAWNRGDAAAFAGLFTPAAEYLTGAGERVHGRPAIAQLVERTPPQVSLVGQPEAECRTGRGRLGFAWSVAASGVTRRGRITCACVRHESGWLVETLRNEEARGTADEPGEDEAASSGAAERDR